MKPLFVAVACVLLWAAPAPAFSKQPGFPPMCDGVPLAYVLYEPDGRRPARGWKGPTTVSASRGTTRAATVG